MWGVPQTELQKGKSVCVCVFGMFSHFFSFIYILPHTHTHDLLVQEKNVSENIHKKLITGLFHRKT